MKKRSVLLLIALIIAIIYICMQFGNYSSGAKVVTADTETAEQTGQAVGTALGMAILLPHLILVVLPPYSTPSRGWASSAGLPSPPPFFTLSAACWAS